MKIYRYKCSLLSDVIITADAATEAPSDILEYIPGSKFLGIVASVLYENEEDEDQKSRILDLFHNGTVQYGDANLFWKDSEFLKVPFSWYKEKGATDYDDIYIHHLIQSRGKQLKQMRSGYFSMEKRSFINVHKRFSLKSAQDSEKRKSKDEQMFGYQSLKAGSEWIFDVVDHKGDYAEEIKNILRGTHRIGRSRSAEYGLVEIEFLGREQYPGTEIYSGEIVIYAKSNLCFVDEYSGEYTAQPSAKQLCGDPEAKILWEHSQVRSRNYKVWNRHRWNKDRDRLIIERGSVFVLKLKNEVTSDFYLGGIGSHVAEGFGKVVANPEFLKADSEVLPVRFAKDSIDYSQKSVVEEGDQDDIIFEILKKRHERNDFDFQIDRRVNDFEREYGNRFNGLKPNQWSTLRNYAKHLEKREDFIEMIFNTEFGFVYRGQSEREWREKGRRIVLEKFLEDIPDSQFFPFVIKLSSQMPKRN